MKATANYDLNIDWVSYSKWMEYDIDDVINEANPYGWEYFTKVEPLKADLPKELEAKEKLEK